MKVITHGMHVIQVLAKCWYVVCRIDRVLSHAESCCQQPAVLVKLLTKLLQYNPVMYLSVTHLLSGAAYTERAALRLERFVLFHEISLEYQVISKQGGNVRGRWKQSD